MHKKVTSFILSVLLTSFAICYANPPESETGVDFQKITHFFKTKSFKYICYGASTALAVFLVGFLIHKLKAQNSDDQTEKQVTKEQNEKKLIPIPGSDLGGKINKSDFKPFGE